jgi:hypothetical protein
MNGIHIGHCSSFKIKICVILWPRYDDVSKLTCSLRFVSTGTRNFANYRLNFMQLIIALHLLCHLSCQSLKKTFLLCYICCAIYPVKVLHLLCHLSCQSVTSAVPSILHVKVLHLLCHLSMSKCYICCAIYHVKVLHLLCHLSFQSVTSAVAIYPVKV